MFLKHAVAVAALALSSCAHAQSSQRAPQNIAPVHFAGWDIYGTDRLSIDELKEKWGKSLQDCVDRYLSEDFSAYDTCRKSVVGEIQKRYGFASADISLIRYYNRPEGSPTYGTLDIVESWDEPTRMTFLARPSRHFIDPDGLLAAWDEYIKIGYDLLAHGEITGARVDCPAFHCIFGHKHPKLAPYEPIFVRGVAKHADDLKEIFLNDANDQHRADAAFLLAYTQDGEALVKLLSQRLSDESSLVRNNVMRVFSDIADSHRELTIPMEEIIRELDFPATTDRNKSSAVVLWKVTDSTDREKYREVIMRKAVPYLLRMLQLVQPNNHDMAYNALRILSGKDYGERDYVAWNDWFLSARQIKNPGPPEAQIRDHAVQTTDVTRLPQILFDQLKDRPVITVGEMHGTNEAPAFVLGLLDLFKKNRHSVALALEMSETDQTHVDRFLKSGDVEALKKAPFFHRDFQDGRSSRAMADLIIETRKRKGIPIVFFDPVNSTSGQDRDTKMAKNILSAFKRVKKSAMIILAGNVHAAIRIGTPWDSNYRPMGYELLHQEGSPWMEKDVRAIKLRYQQGRAWVCMDNKPCGDTPLSEAPSRYAMTLPWSRYFLAEDEVTPDGYNATVYVPTLSASAPWVEK